MNPGESSAYISLKKLRQELFKAVFTMEKANRSIYGNELMEYSGKTIGYFTTAYTVPEDEGRKMYLDLAIAAYAVLRADLEFCVEQNIIHFKRDKATSEDRKNGIVNDEGKCIAKEKINLFRLVAKVDDDLCKWRACLSKGTPVSALC